jgi:hypothetical protein
LLAAVRPGGFRLAGFRFIEGFRGPDFLAGRFRVILVSLLASVLLEHVDQVRRHGIVLPGPRRRLDLFAVGAVGRAQGTDGVSQLPNPLEAFALEQCL